ncbi:RNA polymerase subunit sigma-70 [Streptomyces griseocarneus]|nr:RNA polymerase subunit sigma-70 [Streptomyces griseocarneus]
MTEDLGANGVDPPQPGLSPEKQEELSKILKEIRPRLLHANRRMCHGDPQLAEDFTQRAELAVVEHVLRGGVFAISPHAFAHTVSRNAIRSWARSKAREREESVGEFPETSAPHLNQGDGDDPTWSAVRFQLDLLEIEAVIGDKEKYDIWLLSKVWQCTGVEIAEMFGLSESKVSRVLTETTAKLRDAFGTPRDGSPA